MDTRYATGAAWISGRLVRLPRHTVVDTADINEAETVISRLLSEHHMVLHGPPREFHAQVRECAFGDLQLAYFKYGTAFTVQSSPLGCYAVNLTLRGQSKARVGASMVEAIKNEVTVFSPFAASSLTWSRDAEVLCLRVPKTALEHHFRKIAGKARDEIVFMPLVRAGSGHLLRSVISSALVACAGDAERLPEALSWQLRDALLTAMLLELPHNQAEMLLARRKTAASRVCDAAIGLMRRDLCAAPSIPGLAAKLGVSERSLQASFREHLQTTPSATLKQLRLEAVHEALLRSDPAQDTVTRVAANVGGFFHLGRFANEYFERFGEHPSDTLRR
jgi:AraC-like DNA-binding protein